MRIPQEILLKLNLYIPDWTENYELVIVGHVLFLEYVGFDGVYQNYTLDLPEPPRKEDFYEKPQYQSAMQEWEKETTKILNSYCDKLSGENYKIGILGEVTSSEGFYFTFS